MTKEQIIAKGKQKIINSLQIEKLGFTRKSTRMKPLIV